jgi:hypothetical protein
MVKSVSRPTEARCEQVDAGVSYRLVDASMLVGKTSQSPLRRCELEVIAGNRAVTGSNRLVTAA